MNFIAKCDIYNHHIHGYTDDTSMNIHGHFVIRYYIDIDEFYSNEYKEYVNKVSLVEHPFIRNYHAISTNNIVDIVEPLLLDGGELVAILKTHYIRLFQRKWRRTRIIP